MAGSALVRRQLELTLHQASRWSARRLPRASPNGSLSTIGRYATKAEGESLLPSLRPSCRALLVPLSF